VPEDGGQRFGFAANLVGSRDPVALHGGVLAAAGIATARSALGPDAGLRPIDFSIDYLRSGLPQPTQLRPRLVSRTRKTALVEVDVLQDDGARLVARVRTRFYDAGAATPAT
jgi:acyl-coenzyme A thioesterase PaaI-like protein